MMVMEVDKDWYKFLSVAVNEQLNEITQKALENTKIKDFLKVKKTKQLSEIFENADRLVIPFAGRTTMSEKDKVLLSYIDILRKHGWVIDLTEPFGYASKVFKKEFGGKTFVDKKRVKIGPLIMALGQEAADFWQKNNKFYSTKGNELYFNSDYSIIFSRVPVDILRMSDHDGWTSCHSANRDFFKCAVQEAVTGGAVAYVVNSRDLNKINLTDPEIFIDNERKIDGIKPLERIRIRRFIYEAPDVDDDIEIGIPERKVYGQHFPGFISIVNSFLMEKQKNSVQQIRDIVAENNNQLFLNKDEWVLKGGSYKDSFIFEMFKDFFGNEFPVLGDTDVDIEDLEVEEVQFTSQVERIISDHNKNNHYTYLFADIIENDAITFGGTIRVELDVGKETTDIFKKIETLNNNQLTKINSDFFRQYEDSGLSIADISLQFKIFNKKLFVSVNIYGDETTLEDFYQFSEQFKDFNLPDNIDKIKANIIFVLKLNGVIASKESETLKNVAGTLINFRPNSPFLTSTGALARTKDLYITDFKQAYDQFYALTEHLPDVEKIKLLNIFRNKLVLLIKQMFNDLNDLEFRTKINSIFLGQKQVLNKQGTLFHPTQFIKDIIKEEKQIADSNISNIDIYFILPGLLQHENKKWFLPIEISWKDPKIFKDDTRASIETYIQFLKFMDKMMLKIHDYVFNLYKQGLEEIFIQIKEMIETQDPKIFKQQSSGINHNQQNLPGINENKKKLFNLDGSTWRMLK